MWSYYGEAGIYPEKAQDRISIMGKHRIGFILRKHRIEKL